MFQLTWFGHPVVDAVLRSIAIPVPLLRKNTCFHERQSGGIRMSWRSERVHVYLNVCSICRPICRKQKHVASSVARSISVMGVTSVTHSRLEAVRAMSWEEGAFSVDECLQKTPHVPTMTPVTLPNSSARCTVHTA